MGITEVSLSLSIPHTFALLSLLLLLLLSVLHILASLSVIARGGRGFHIHVWGEWEGAWREGICKGVIIIVHPPHLHVISIIVIWWVLQFHHRGLHSNGLSQLFSLHLILSDHFRL